MATMPRRQKQISVGLPKEEPYPWTRKLLPPSNREPISFQLSKLDRPGFTLIEVEVSRLDQLWRESGEGYINSDGTGATEGRLEGFAAWLSANPSKPINAPWVYINGRGSVSFSDGRHRFALLRERGYHSIKIAVRKNEVARMWNLLKSDKNQVATGRHTTKVSDKRSRE